MNESSRGKYVLRWRCFVDFSCGDAVFVNFFCGVAVFRAPMSPSLITEPFRPTNFTFPKKKHLANRIAHLRQNGSLTSPGFIIISKATLWCVSFASNRMKNWICALQEIKIGYSFRTDFPTGRTLWYDSRNINSLSVTSWPWSFK